MSRDDRSNANHPELTERERLMLESIWDGCTISAVAQRMNIDYRTAESESYRLRHKFGVSNMVSLVRAALRYGMLRV